jgi:ribonuclease G
MGKEICISSTPHETRLAILEDDQLAEIYYERENEYTLAGSIYNGRVTRVLPGMQSAFVDVGLERDAFLYVTDFLELEDSEDTDELEKATIASGNQPPREVRHQNAPGENAGQRPAQKTVEKQDSRQDRQPKARRLTVESVPETADATATESLAVSGQTGDAQDDSSGSSSRRWRGRRRRRGGSASAGSPESQSETDSSKESSESSTHALAESEVAPVIHAASFASTPTPRADRSSAPPVPFVLPGESLRKYGGKPEDDAPQSRQEPAAPARPASTFKPSTLIEAPLAWDGSGLLPGESLSKHRSSRAKPAEETEPRQSATSPDEIEEEDFVTERAQSNSESAHETAAESTQDELLPELEEDHLAQEEPLEEDEFEETAETAPQANPGTDDPEDYQIEPVIDEPSVDDDLAEPAKRQDESENRDPDASASHRFDPLLPSGFRLFGFGKKKDEKTALPKSNYKPGSGHIVEEVIEGEEFDAPRHSHHGKADDHDLEDFEEETLPKHLRTGDLGELLQEAHLEHRIQMNFDSKDGDEVDDEETAAEGQPSAGGALSRQRPDRSARGRRGRGAAAAPVQGNRRGPSRRSMQTSDLPIISDLLKAGQEILVQIAKEPIAKKGARITSHIALPGRFLVFMPTVTHIGVSRKIASDEERQRLKRILVHERGEASGGFIVRTAAEGASEDELRTDLRMLLNLWADIKKRSDESKSPALIYHDLGLI